LIAKQHNNCDSQAVVAWATDNGGAMPDPFADSYGLVDEGPQTENEKLTEAQDGLGADYAKRFRDAHRGMGNAQSLVNFNRRAAVMAVDAATTGRMAITFYQDLPQNEYIERLIKWHDSCKYWFRRDGRDIIQAPSVFKIITAVYGEPKGEGYAKIQKQARLRLLRNIVCAEPFERGWVVAAANRVSNPFSYDKQDGGWDKPAWEGALNVTCAITRKFYNDVAKKDKENQEENGKKEEEEAFKLALDTKCEDRDYLFGRLLAVADRLESHARFLQVGRDDTDKRPTNAVRYMTAFAVKPVRTWKVIVGQLNPYIQRLNGAEWYQQTIDDIMALLSDSFDDSPLDGKYLLGYSHQRRALFNKKEDATNESDQ
jgi:CRISPR-associated protein Csd1